MITENLRLSFGFGIVASILSGMYSLSLKTAIPLVISLSIVISAYLLSLTRKRDNFYIVKMQNLLILLSSFWLPTYSIFFFNKPEIFFNIFLLAEIITLSCCFFCLLRFLIQKDDFLALVKNYKQLDFLNKKINLDIKVPLFSLKNKTILNYVPMSIGPSIGIFSTVLFPIENKSLGIFLILTIMFKLIFVFSLLLIFRIVTIKKIFNDRNISLNDIVVK